MPNKLFDGPLLADDSGAANLVVSKFSLTHVNGYGQNSNSTNAGGTYPNPPFTNNGLAITINADGSYTANADDVTAAKTFSIVYYASDDDNSNVSGLLQIDTILVAPVGVNDTDAVNEDATVTVDDGDDEDVLGDADDSASLTVSAIRTGDTEGSGTGGTIGSALTGTYGQLTLNANGSYSYVANQSATDDLDTGDTVTDAFNYTVSDGTATDTATLTFTVTGVNDAPVAVNDTGAVNEDATLSVADGSGDIIADDDTDADDSATLTVSATVPEEPLPSVLPVRWAETVSVALSSASVSLSAIMSPDPSATESVASSLTAPVSLTATGASFTPVTVNVRVAVSVAVPSLTV
jgi:VCBS repeat-containing protein